jgi:sorbitol/mannitol transport system substrate-binding protein
MTLTLRALMGASAAVCLATAALAQTSITVATVNNGDMIRMQGLMDDFNAKHPDITVEWVTLEENELRQRVTTDIATKGGQFDVLTIGTYEVPIWGKQGWLVPLDFGPEYGVDDLIPSIRGGLSVDGTLYAAPFYGESSMLMYRKDLADKAGVQVPERPTWPQIKDLASKMHDPKNGVYGICLRGKPGWGDNMAFLSTLVNTFGGQWFDMQWKPQLESKPWKDAINFYVDLLKNYGPPGSAANSFNEILALTNSGKCGMWIDATIAASFVSDPKQSKVAAQMAFAQAPTQVTPKGANWLWAWSLAIPAGSKNVDAAQKFVSWATWFCNRFAEHACWDSLKLFTRCGNNAKRAPRHHPTARR